MGKTFRPERPFAGPVGGGGARNVGGGGSRVSQQRSEAILKNLKSAGKQSKQTARPMNKKQAEGRVHRQTARPADKQQAEGRIHRQAAGSADKAQAEGRLLGLTPSQVKSIKRFTKGGGTVRFTVGAGKAKGK